MRLKIRGYETSSAVIGWAITLCATGAVYVELGWLAALVVLVVLAAVKVDLR